MRKTYAAKLRSVLLDCVGNGDLSALSELSRAELIWLAHDWQVWARDEQLCPLPDAVPSAKRTGILREGGARAGRAVARRGSAARVVLPLTDADRCSAPASSAGARLGRVAQSRSGASRDSKPPTSVRAVSAPGGRLDEGESPGANIKRVWLILGGRGSGKTRAGAEWVRERATAHATGEPERIALVGKTIHDVRAVMVEGVSGLLAVHRDDERPLFEPSKRRLTWKNGCVAELFSADEAEGLRGPQFSAAWCDELAKWERSEHAFDMLQFALRLGDNPQAVVTTTPRATKFLKKLIADEATATTHLSTADNAGNLAPAFLAEMTRRYANSDLGRQELYGEIIEETAGSLWRRQWIEDARVDTAPELLRVVVAVDPPVTATSQSDACGIVVAGLGADGRAYVLADRTIQGRTPDIWARAAIRAYEDFSADRIVAEVNQGGDLVAAVMQQFKANLPIVKVRATRGKWVRAEPVAALYAEGRVVHAGRHAALEDQLAAFGADGTVKGRSPDRADALVWALTELMLSHEVRPRMRVL